ncbi:MAG: serine/threonine-protein kinase, partial [Myxococcota bacterium]
LMRDSKRLGVKIPTELVVHIAHDILDALDYAHTAIDSSGTPLGIIHRDVSPGNVLLSRRGDVKLTDFGIAWAAERYHNTEAGKLKGKFGYMSPELVGGGAVDARSDIFSTGILIAEMLMGRHLFTAPNDLDVLLMVRDAQIDRLDQYGGDIPESLRSILGQALARLPDERFSSAAVFRDALADWLYSSGTRVSSRDLARFIERVRSGDPTLLTPPDEPTLGKMPEVTLSGDVTRRRRYEAQRRADVGRAAFDSARPESAAPAQSEPYLSPALLAAREASTGEAPGETAAAADSAAPAELPERPPSAVPIEIGDELSSEESVEMESPLLGGTPSDEGSFAEISPVRLLYRLAVDKADGMLLAEGRGGALKEAYFTRGHPEFVASNVKREQLAEYLVNKRVLGRDELSRAAAVLDHFSGRLSDTLVGLGLLEPLEVFRLLGLQSADKLVDVCTWRQGRYRWYQGRKNPWPSRRLHLNTYEIIGSGASLLAVEEVVAWAKSVAHHRPHRTVDNPNLEAFGLGETVHKAYDMLDGVASVTELAGRIPILEARLQFLRTLYLLSECDLA